MVMIMPVTVHEDLHSAKAENKAAFTLSIVSEESGLDLEGDGLACQCIHEDLHASANKAVFTLSIVSEDSTSRVMVFPANVFTKSRLVLDVIIG